MPEPRKIVLDTNCLIASLSRHGMYYPVWKVVSDDKHFEVLEKVTFPRIMVIRLRQFLETLRVDSI